MSLPDSDGAAPTLGTSLSGLEDDIGRRPVTEVEKLAERLRGDQAFEDAVATDIRACTLRRRRNALVKNLEQEHGEDLASAVAFESARRLVGLMRREARLPWWYMDGPGFSERVRRALPIVLGREFKLSPSIHTWMAWLLDQVEDGLDAELTEDNPVASDWASRRLREMADGGRLDAELLRLVADEIDARGERDPPQGSKTT